MRGSEGRPTASMLTKQRDFLCRQEVDGSSAPWDSYADVESLQTHWDNLSAELKRGFIKMGFLTRYGKEKRMAWDFCRYPEKGSAAAVEMGGYRFFSFTRGYSTA